MKYRILLLLFVISLQSPGNTRGKTGLQKTVAENSTVEAYRQRDYFAPLNNVVEVYFSYSFFVPGQTSRIKLIVALPKPIPDRQKILYIECFPRPSRKFSSKCGNKYAEFVFMEPRRRFNVQIHVKAELLRYDLSTAQKKYKEEFFPRYYAEDFLQDGGGIEWDDFRIWEIARTIKGQSEIETVKNIYDYVINNMEYCIYEGDGGATYAAGQKKGDCSEYSELFIALCRAKRIPARVVIGYTVRVDDGLPKHAWAEVYLRKYGWVPFDPTWGEAEVLWLREVKFHTMRPLYIYNKYPDNDEVLSNGEDVEIWWWGDEVEMKESVKFKQWQWQSPGLQENIVTTKPKPTHGVVGGILYTEDNSSAIIDSKVLKEGDTIRGVKIVKIYEAEVEFEKDSRRWTQKVAEAARPFWQ